MRDGANFSDSAYVKEGSRAFALPTLPEGWVRKELVDGILLCRHDVNVTPDSGCVCVIGAFDGVHLGHQALIGQACDEARIRGLISVIVTFDPDPAYVIGEGRPCTRLLESADRLTILALQGADAVFCLRFTPELAHTSWRTFALEVLKRHFTPVSVHVGTNFRFGAQGRGDPVSLSVLGAEQAFEVHAHELVSCDGTVVSATRIRRLIRNGKVSEASRLLGRYHFVRGRVVRGRGEGTSFGFPTANVEVDPLACMPAEGVYGGWVASADRAWPAAINVGAPLTFETCERPSFFEAFLIGFSGDLYGHDIAAAFVRHRRGDRRFTSMSQLKLEIAKDSEWVQKNIGTTCVELQKEAAHR
ncbi:MAG: riboflavin biosynthesis protein RibF [Atopobiaceae bacterium]|jgi:riboflavin kinase/FMN adenylyltransferase